MDEHVTYRWIDQCRALLYAVIKNKQQQVKEILTFILWERLDWLYHNSYTEIIYSHTHKKKITTEIIQT
nr:hypothetical protein [Pectobacterium versatile]